jgi:hypothetical protein
MVGQEASEPWPVIDRTRFVWLRRLLRASAGQPQEARRILKSDAADTGSAAQLNSLIACFRRKYQDHASLATVCWGTVTSPFLASVCGEPMQPLVRQTLEHPGLISYHIVNQ